MIKSNNSSIKYGGGYRNAGPAKEGKRELYRPEDEDEEGLGKRSDVYGELGLSKMQPKYRVIDENSKLVDNQDYGTKQL